MLKLSSKTCPPCQLLVIGPTQLGSISCVSPFDASSDSQTNCSSEVSSGCSSIKSFVPQSSSTNSSSISSHEDSSAIISSTSSTSRLSISPAASTTTVSAGIESHTSLANADIGKAFSKIKNDKTIDNNFFILVSLGSKLLRDYFSV